MAEDVTLQVLKEIRDEIRTTNGSLGDLRQEVRTTNDEVRTTNERLDVLGNRIVDSEIRTATAITGLAGTLYEVRDELRASLDLRPRVERCEREIADIRGRLGSRE